MAEELTLDERLAKVAYDIDRFSKEIHKLQYQKNKHDQIAALSSIVQNLENLKYELAKKIFKRNNDEKRALKKQEEDQLKKEEEDLLKIPSYKDGEGKGKMKFCKCKNCKR